MQKNGRGWTKAGYFQKLSYVSQILDMTSEALGEMVEGDFEDMLTEKFQLVSIRRTFISANRISIKMKLFSWFPISEYVIDDLFFKL